MDAPLTIKWLESLGCMFDKEPDGTMREIHGGGTSRKRMHFSRDYSGAEIIAHAARRKWRTARLPSSSSLLPSSWSWTVTGAWRAPSC